MATIITTLREIEVEESYKELNELTKNNYWFPVLEKAYYDFNTARYMQEERVITLNRKYIVEIRE